MRDLLTEPSLQRAHLGLFSKRRVERQRLLELGIGGRESAGGLEHDRGVQMDFGVPGV